MLEGQPRIAEVGQNETGVHQIKGAPGSGFADVGQLEIDVGQVELSGFACRKVQLGLIDVGTEDPASGADHAGDVEGQIASAGADLEYLHACAQSRALEQGQRRGAHDARKNTQALATRETATND